MATITQTGQAASFQWGLPNGVNITTYGRVTSFWSGRATEKEPLKDKDGCTDGMVYYDMRDEGTLEAIIPAGGVSSAQIAQTVQVGGNTYHIEGCEQNWTAGAWAKVTLTLTHYDGIAVGSGS
jgi:hypothetical protein